MIVEVTYSDSAYERARKYNVKMAYKKGKFDKVYEYTREDIDEDFFHKNEKILNCKRGGGYWLWKPYFIDKTLQKLEEGDYLCYCDAGAFFLSSVHPLIQFMDRENQDILLFELSHPERNWTKRDVFLRLECDAPEYADTKQRIATYLIIKKNVKTTEFVREWLKIGCEYPIISDEDNVVFEQKNYEGFISNRHDQSILSVLSKKWGYPAYLDPSQFRYEIGAIKRIKSRIEIDGRIPYRICICLHRKKWADCMTHIREIISDYFPILRRVVYYLNFS